jgi:hypothetical protein
MESGLAPSARPGMTMGGVLKSRGKLGKTSTTTASVIPDTECSEAIWDPFAMKSWIPALAPSVLGRDDRLWYCVSRPLPFHNWHFNL